MRTTALTDYQKHVKNFAKTYKGKNLMKAAAKAWSKTTAAPKKKPQKSSPKKKGGTKMGKKKTSKKSFRLPGGLGPKGILMGVLGMAIVPQLIPTQIPGAARLGTGLALRAVGLSGGGALASVGIMELVAGFLLPRLSGIIPGGNGAGARGGTDF